MSRQVTDNRIDYQQLKDQLNRIGIHRIASDFYMTPHRDNKVKSPSARDTNWSLHLYTDTNSFFDFASPEKKGGDILDFVSYVKGISIGEAAKLLADHYSIRTGQIVSKSGYPWQPFVEGKVGKSLEFAVAFHDIYTGKYTFHKLRFSGKYIKYGIEHGDRMYLGLNGRKRKTDIVPSLAGDLAVIKSAQTVYVVEGEKDLLTMLRMGYKATLTAGGSGDWQPEFADILEGKNLIIMQDNDDKGNGLTRDILASVQGRVKSIKVVLPYTDKPGGDVSDYFDCGGTCEELEEMISKAEAVKIDTEAEVVPAVSIESELDRTASGSVASTIGNVLKVLNGDPKFTGMFRYNLMSDNVEVFGAWWTRYALPITDNDLNNIRFYLEQQYSLQSERNVPRAIDIVAHENAYHPVKDYLDSLPEWDGEIDYIAGLFPKYLGAAKSSYITAVTHLIFTSAIARVMTPGVKVDQTAVLIDRKQGSGKSTMVRLLAVQDDWYTDSLQNLDNQKDTFEKMAGKWVIELGEMLATTNAKTVESIKSFLSRQADSYRTPYERFARTIFRQNIFIGTSNDINCLPPDLTGNRRFLPIRCDASKAEIHPLQNEAATRDYIRNCWIQAMTLYRRGESRLTLSHDVDIEAQKEQEACTPEDALTGLLQEWLDNCKYDTVCSMMLYYEAIHDNNENAPRPKQWELREISQIMNTKIQGWQRYPTSDSKKRFSGYGKQRAWQRIEDFTTIESEDNLPFN